MQFSRAISSNINALIIIFLLALVIIAYTNTGNIGQYMHVYDFNQQNEILNNTFMQKLLVPNNRNIFFLETSCSFKGQHPDGLHLTNRQACAIYSTAKMNPSRPVILYHSCPLHKDIFEKSSKASKYLLKLPNFYLLNLRYEDLLRGTLVDNIISDIQSSIYPIEHGADVLRLVLLQKFGGAYMDLDFISIKPLDSLPNNVVSPESSFELSNGFFQFDDQGKGNEFLKEMLMDLSKNYNKETWSGNGPILVKRNFLKFCNITKVVPFTKLPANSCAISVCNVTTFYPIAYRKWKLFFTPEQTEFVMKTLNDSVAVHFWNFLSKDESVKVGENSAYEVLARQHCPDIFESAGDSF